MPGFRVAAARAGNTYAPKPMLSRLPVHPRSGGEHRAFQFTAREHSGSSPRRRGTPIVSDTGSLGGRFIPAQAGNTTPHSACEAWRAVHPRAGGEHTALRGGEVDFAGSSPRRRGTQMRSASGLPRMRFIPAQAGNTERREGGLTIQPVHPRAGGEHACISAARFALYGSSPRRRGTRRRDRCLDRISRFIPAQAGNTRSSPPAPPMASVHPRAGGEHEIDRDTGDIGAGSSPRRRGTLPPRHADGGSVRFIPAQAGNTPPRCAHLRPKPVHPRAGGEHLVIGVAVGFAASRGGEHMTTRMSMSRGSSPRRRGTHSRCAR